LKDALSDEYPHRPPDFGDEAVRRSHGPAALRAFARIMQIWQVPGIESRHLLGLATGTKVEDLDATRLSEEQLLRISYLIGIYKALRILYNDALANRWVGVRNTNALFAGRSPLEYMARGDLDALRNVRRLLDARCAGNN
jgi:hypothetical protein